MLDDRDYARAQVQRLQAIPDAPFGLWTEPNALREYVDALVAASTSTIHAKDTIDSIIETTVRFPSPADVRRVAYERRTEEQRHHTGCERCNGTGWAVVEPGFVERCGCRGGV